MLGAAASVMLHAELIWTRYTSSLKKCLALRALLPAFIAMFLGALHNRGEVSDVRIKANDGLKSAQLRSNSAPHPSFSPSIQELIHKTF